MTASPNKIKYISEYNKKNMRDVVVHLNKKTDQDIIEILDNVPNKAGYIKSLIRAANG